jgi:Zn-dependent protease
VFWGILNLIPISPLDGGHVVRNFLRMFLQERTAFVIAIWVGMIAGTLAAILCVVSHQYFIAFFLALYVWRNVQLWQDFRRSGMTGE